MITEGELVKTEVPGYRSHVEDVNGDGLDDVIFDNIVELDLFAAEGDGEFGPAIVVWTSDTPLSLDGNNFWSSILQTWMATARRRSSRGGR